MRAGLIFALFFSQYILGISGDCPCQTKVDNLHGYLKLTCNEGSIADLPEGISGPCAGASDFNQSKNSNILICQ